MEDLFEIIMFVVLYLTFALATARNRYRALWDDSERGGVSIALGVVWPLTLTFLIVRFLSYWAIVGLIWVIKYDNPDIDRQSRSR